MDFKKFGIVIAMLGLLIAGYGGVHLAMNQPLEAELASGGGWQDALKNVARRWEAASENTARERRRGSATKVVLAGGIIVFLGLGIMASAKDGSGPTQS
jgi:hypothetical protein